MKLFSLLVTGGLLTTLICCKKSFLQSKSVDGTYTDQTAFQTLDFFNSYIFGAYHEMDGGNESRGSLNWVLTPGIISQDITQTDETQQPIDAFLTPGNSAVTSSWGDFYTIIARANTLLSKLPDAPASISDSDKLRIQGEAKFLRGFSYFNLARSYGNIPLILETFHTAQSTIAPSTEDQVWDQVILDLKDAVANLPTRDQWGADNLGRATKGSALAYLANAYMYKKDWASASDASQQLIALNEYSLLADVRDVFTAKVNNTNESIFEVQYRDVTDGNILWSGQPNTGTIAQEWTAPRNIGSQWAPGGGWGSNITNIKLADSYEPDDDRRKKLLVAVGDTYKGESMDSALTLTPDILQSHSAFSTKYWMGPGSSTTNYYLGPDMIQMRYAEFLLNYSEILFESGDAASAYKQLNLVRERSKLADKPVTSDPVAFMTDLMNERRWELNWEPNLWFHYLRTGTAAGFLQSVYGITFKQAWNKYPIPQSEIDLNPKIKQNPGY